MDSLTRDAVGFVRALDIAPVHWVGLSMGGFVGMRLAARHAMILQSLTLLNTSARAENPAKIGEYKRLAWAQQLVGFEPIASMVAPHLFGPTYRDNPSNMPSLKRWGATVNQRKRSGIRKAVYGVADRTGIDHEIAAIIIPTLVVVGSDDSATPPSESQLIASRIPGARLQVIADCGHSSALEQPAAVAESIRDFLAEFPVDSVTSWTSTE
jgi:pimeloyl-ACP methyl ester carboxylesterase